jgi:hypothetical protein
MERTKKPGKGAEIVANIFDYLDWRGDLSFVEAPFNEVDNLIFSKLVYVDLSGIVPPPGGAGGIVLREAAARYFEVHKEKEPLGLLIPAEIQTLFRRLSETARFGGLILSGGVNLVDEEKEEQFSALTIELPDGSDFIAFRGTDDNIIGWKENFGMSFRDAIPAQKDALLYLCEAGARSAGALRLGGHSKGGNLAVYAAIHCRTDMQERILRVYNNDGPGFLEPAKGHPGYRNIRGRIVTLVPQSSLVGMLLNHSDDYEVVESSKLGPFQHNGFTWEVLGPSFVRRSDLSVGGQVFSRAVREWADELSLDQRRIFTEAFFEVLTSTGARTLTDLNERRLQQAVEMARKAKSLKPETQHLLSEAMNLMLRDYVRGMAAVLPETVRSIRGTKRTGLFRGQQREKNGEEPQDGGEEDPAGKDGLLPE